MVKEGVMLTRRQSAGKDMINGWDEDLALVNFLAVDINPDCPMSRLIRAVESPTNSPGSE
jgi:hypothetical protein